ncbi:MAG: hypothetical protein AAF806_07940 [Bacteroidota bacterium]
MLNTQNHRSVVNQEGRTTSVLVPYEDYKQMMEVFERSGFLSELKSDLHQSMSELKEAERGGKSL